MVFSYIYNYFFQNESQNNINDIDSINDSINDFIDNSINDSIDDSINDSIDDSINDSINDSTKNNTDENINLCIYNFYDTKQDLLTFLRYKKSKLYNKLNKINFVYNKHFIEINNDIYNYNKYYESKINKIDFNSNFNYHFDELCKDIRHDYKTIKYELETYLRNI